MVISTMSRKIKSNVNITKIKNFLEEKANILPVVSVKGSHVKVGKYYCLERNGIWEVYDDTVKVNTFMLRSSALSWCVAKMQEQSADAQSIEHNDFKYSKYATDSMIFYNRFKTVKDKFRKELMYIRYEEAEYHKNHIKRQLEESIKKIKIN